MCDHDAKLPFKMVLCKPAFNVEPARAGSRRRRLWDLSRDCHCPVIGVCLPLIVLRQAVNRAFGGRSQADDYELHVGAVSACTSRNQLSDVLQNELERRYATIIRHFKCAKSTDSVATLWRQAVDRGDVAGAFWAALTHPRCDSLLEDALCREMHMIQHQAGATTRVDRCKFDALMHENGVVTRELAKVQERCTRLLSDRNREIEKLSAELMQARSVVVGKDSMIAFLRADLAELQASVPELESRMRLKQKLAAMVDRQHTQNAQLGELRRELAEAREQIEILRAAQVNVACTAATENAVPIASPIKVHLRDKTVLCVGGRSGSVADYRGIVEQIGGRFAHHDGGLENNVSLLQASLAAADLVICQTGCISHNAYWRVKDFCKRTGKRCVFVNNPSASSLSKSLSDQLRQIVIHDVTDEAAENDLPPVLTDTSST